MIRRYGDDARIESTSRADELAATGDDAGGAISRRIEDAAGAGPSRAKQSASRIQGADNVRDPDLAICAHPRLGEVRDDGWSSHGDLRGRRRRDRADSQTRLTADGRELLLTRYTEPEPELNLLLKKLKLEPPAQPPPKITASAPAPPTPL
jgi:hypothetical protein